MANMNPTDTSAPKSTSTSTSTPGTAAAPTLPSFATFGAALDPMSMWATTQQTFTKLMTDAAARTQSFADQYVALEGQMITRAKDAISTWAQLSHDALAYSVQLSSETRKVGVDAARKMGVQA